MEKRKFRLADVVLSVICVVFVAEAAAYNPYRYIVFRSKEPAKSLSK